MHAYLLSSLNFGPVVVERLVAALPESAYDTPTAEDRFTPREIVAHLADWEPIMRDRIRAAVESPGSTIQAYDEGRMAIDRAYARSDIHTQTKLFVEERKKTAEYANRLTQDQLRQTVTHSERGLQTAEDLIGTLIGHDMYHVEQLSAGLGVNR